MADFALPTFFDYPPYFTLQPNKETQQKQRESWKEVIVAYCRHHRIFMINLDDADFPLFENTKINRKLSLEAQRLMLDDVAASGQGRWMDPPTKRRFLVLWRSVAEWAAALHAWARASGLEDSVVSLEELAGGQETAGSDVEGLPRELLSAALRTLESQGKARVFAGGEQDDLGVKFFA